jgi:pimeloyl-ACP methyl ester carboxylesterase
MKRSGIAALPLVLLVLAAFLGKPPAAWSDPLFPAEGLAEVNGVKLQYLDWGGSGPAMILIHGLADDPHHFDDLAPAFTDRYRVIAYARRGSGSSDVKGPYDTATLTEDLRQLMDALKIEKAHLVGHSAGGNEITEMAARHPERVLRIVYLDAGYDWADPDFRAAFKGRPYQAFDKPQNAMSSLDSYISYEKTNWYPSLDDTRRVEAYLRKKVIVQADGSLRDRTTKELRDALYAALWSNKPRDYAGVHCPALAIYAEHPFPVDVVDAKRRNAALVYENKYWVPFRTKSIERLKREVANVEVVHVPGAHGNFIVTQRQRLVDTMRQFLGELDGPQSASNHAAATQR